MATIVFGTYMVRYPLGGMLSCDLQWIVGFQRLGHQIFVVEKSGWAGSCYDPVRRIASDDCSHGFAATRELLGRFGLGDNLCYVDAQGACHGMSKQRVTEAFAAADVYVDYGAHGLWHDEAAHAATRVYVDGEPAFRQIRLELNPKERERLSGYDHHFTIGQNVGTRHSTAPTGGIAWKHVHSPVVADLFAHAPPPPANAPFTTVMNWQSHDRLDYQGVTYGQKDVEFAKFMSLPQRAVVALEVAVSGKAPAEELQRNGWRVRDAQSTTISYDAFVNYVHASAGEFSVCKNVFVATRSGWFSDRSAIYLASGRPAVVQDTGFSAHLPCGRGLFAVNSLEEAADALQQISADYPAQSAAARAVARESLDARVVLKTFLAEIGVD